jgi:hypothetical protein
MPQTPLDPALIAQLRKHAEEHIWKNPDVVVLRKEHLERYSVLVKAIQNCILASHRRRKLILPDLEAFNNGTVGVFSDYSGESTGKYHTYSFLTYAYDGTLRFSEQMKALRASTGLAQKEIAFKDFGMGQMQRALPKYLEIANSFVPGFLLTVVVDKRLTSLFGSNERSTQRELAKALVDNDLGTWKPEIAEKLTRIVHICAFLVGLLASSGQKIFWMSDNDAICANEALHRHMLNLFANSLSLYTDPECYFPTVGGATPFKECDLETLDLLSITDVVSSSVEHYLTKNYDTRSADEKMKPGAEKVIQWLAHDGIGLKKMNVLIQPGHAGKVKASTLEFKLQSPPADATIVPVVV